MSFILDALKKLEREKETHEPGVVMVGPVPWGQRDRRRRPGLALVAALALVALGGAFLWLRPGPEPSAPRGESEGEASPSSAASTARPEAPRPRSPRPLETEPTAPPARGGTTALDRDAGPAFADAPGTATTTGEGATPPPAPLPPAEPEYRLTAISSRDGHPIALLNDRLVREGDSFEGITVVRIGETSVEIEVDGERKTVGF